MQTTTIGIARFSTRVPDGSGASASIVVVVVELLAVTSVPFVAMGSR